MDRCECKVQTVCGFGIFFFEMHVVGNALKAYIADSKEKNRQNDYLQWGLNQGLVVFYSDAFLTELTWQVLNN